jgi:hypothetical protein
MDSFHDLTETKKGDVGEEIVADHLESLGCQIWKPRHYDKSHLIDFVCVNPHKASFLLDVKTKPSMLRYPQTGFDKNDLETYKSLDVNNNVYIVWVDEYRETIYYQFIHKLPEPRMMGRICLWQLCDLEIMRKLTTEEVSRCKEFNNRKPEYTREYEEVK